MNFKNFILLASVIAVVVAGQAFAQSASTADEKAPLPVVTSPIVSFPTMATPTFSIGGTATNIGRFLPAGTKGFWAAPVGGNVNYGGSAVAAGAGWPSITSGTTQIFYVSSQRVPAIYFISATAGATYTVRITPFK